MNRIYLYGPPVIHREVESFEFRNEFVECILVLPVQYEPKAALILMLAKKNNGSQEIGIF